MKVFYKKQKPTIITYRRYKHISNEVFMADVQNKLSQVTSENDDLEFDLFKAALKEQQSSTIPANISFETEEWLPTFEICSGDIVKIIKVIGFQ